MSAMEIIEAIFTDAKVQDAWILGVGATVLLILWYASLVYVSGPPDDTNW